MIRSATIATLIFSLAPIGPVLAQTSKDQQKQEDEQRAKSEDARRKAEEAISKEMELQRQRAKVVIMAAENEARAAQEEAEQILIEPYVVPWEVDKDFDKVRVLFDMAGAQHEITIMLIEEGKIDDAVKEASKIMTLGFPERYDLFLVNELDEIVGELESRSQYDAAIKILQMGQNYLHHPEAKAGCLMQVAKIHRMNNRRDLAIQAYRQAIALNQQALAKREPEKKKK